MKRILRVLSSVQLFLVLLAVIVVLAAIATFIPQGLDRSAYYDRYTPLFASAITAIGITNFFRSTLLFVLLVAVELNLILCTMPRLWRRVVATVRGTPSGRGGGDGRLGRFSQLAIRFGPDIIHLGLIVAIAGGLLIAATREEKQFLVPLGAVVGFDEALPPITVVDSREIRDGEGRVIDWQIDLAYDGQKRTVAINDPIGIDGYRVHFFHWGRERVIVLRDPSGVEYSVHIGEGLVSPDGNAHVFAGVVDADSTEGLVPAQIQLLNPEGEIVGERLLAPGDRLGQYVYTRADTEVLNGFTVTSDTGRIPVLVGLVFILGGFGIYSVGTWRKHG